MREDPPEELIRKISTHELDIILTNNLTSIKGDDLIIKKIGEPMFQYLDQKNMQN